MKKEQETKIPIAIGSILTFLFSLGVLVFAIITAVQLDKGWKDLAERKQEWFERRLFKMDSVKNRRLFEMDSAFNKYKN